VTNARCSRATPASRKTSSVSSAPGDLPTRHSVRSSAPRATIILEPNVVELADRYRDPGAAAQMCCRTSPAHDYLRNPLALTRRGLESGQIRNEIRDESAPRVWGVRALSARSRERHELLRKLAPIDLELNSELEGRGPFRRVSPEGEQIEARDKRARAVLHEVLRVIPLAVQQPSATGFQALQDRGTWPIDAVEANRQLLARRESPSGCRESFPQDRIFSRCDLVGSDDQPDLGLVEVSEEALSVFPVADDACA
jgi:hypothetical protein